MDKAALYVAGTIFFLMSLAHVMRIIFNVQASINRVYVPMEASAFFAALGCVLAIWMFRCAKK